MILESTQVAHILSLTIQGGGTTLISPRSRTNPQTKEEYPSRLEMQVGQLANHLGERDKGKLPSQLVNNPKACIIENSSNQEHAHAIVTLRPGRRVDNHWLSQNQTMLIQKQIMK
jgi:hypothetical protein